MRDWLTIIIVLLILGILLDGLRRMRAYRKHSLTMSRDIPDDEYEDEVPSSEFPKGGARVVAYRDSSDAESITENARKNYAASRQTKGSRNKIPEQVALNLDVPAPMLMDPLNENESSESMVVDNGDPVADIDEDYGFDSLESNLGEPSLGSLDDLDDLAPQLSTEGVKNYSSPLLEDDTPVSPYQSPIDQKSPPPKKPVVQKPLLKPKQKPKKAAPVKQEVKPEAIKAPDMVLVINVMARRGEVFSGPGILEAFLESGLRYGDMDIFHRHESADGKGKVLFSLANIVMPGVFDLSEMNHFETPGFSMFLSLPIAGDSLGVYELMADTAQSLALQLGGELKDEHRSVMTRQTIEHDRQRVIEYERQKRLERA